MPPSIVHEFVPVAALLWVEGTTVPFERVSIDPSDEGVLIGHWVWESTRTIVGLPWLGPAHVDLDADSGFHPRRPPQ
jgi:hypothetical protein